MKKLLAVVISSLLLLTAFAGCSGDKEENSQASGENQGATTSTQLNLYTWEGMFPPEVIEGFESETGISINYVNFDFDETMLTKLEAANGGEYDLVIADDYIIETVIELGLAQKLDTSKIQGWDNINPIYQGQFFDPQNEYTMPYGAGVQTIVYDPAQITTEITGYGDLWDASLADSIGIIGNYRVINGLSLKVNGESYNTEDLAAIQTAGDKLMELAPNIRLIKDDNIQDDLISGEIGAAVMYTSQVTMAKMANPDLKVVFPSEGIGFGIMAGFVPSNAPHADAAYAFMQYLLKPEVAAQCFQWLGYYSTNSAADEFIADEFKEFLTLPEGVTDRMEMIQNIGPEAQDLHTQIWTGFKAACGA